MKTCPLLWRQSESPDSALLEKSVDLDNGAGSTPEETAVGLRLECLGAACRFATESGACLFDRLARLVTGEEIAEGLALATATVTDETRAALDCTAGRLGAIEARLGGEGSDPGPTAELARALAGWREELRGELAGDRVAREQTDRAAAEWREGQRRRTDDMEERWESMVLSLTELTERIESAIGVIQRHIESETEQSRRRELEAKLAAAKRANNAGVALYHARDLERARERFREAITIAPEFVEAHNNLGLVETELGNAEEATRQFQRAIELDPSLSASYNNLGYVFFVQENYEEAIAMYEEAIARAANGSAAWTNLGNAQFKLGNLEQARAAWEKAVELDPGNRKAADNLARLLQSAPA